MNNIFFEYLGWSKATSNTNYKVDVYEKIVAEGEDNIEKYKLYIDNTDNSCGIVLYAGSKKEDISGSITPIFKGTIMNKEDLLEAQRLLNIK